MYGGQRSGLNQYQKVESQSTAAFASPHRLIQMLMDGALEKISRAKGYMEQNNIPKKGEFIGWAISIIEGLRVSLDFEKGEPVASNLFNLYDYCNKSVLKDYRNLDTKGIESSKEVISEILDAWKQIR